MPLRSPCLSRHLDSTASVSALLLLTFRRRHLHACLRVLLMALSLFLLCGRVRPIALVAPAFLRSCCHAHVFLIDAIDGMLQMSTLRAPPRAPGLPPAAWPALQMRRTRGQSRWAAACCGSKSDGRCGLGALLISHAGRCIPMHCCHGAMVRACPVQPHQTMPVGQQLNVSIYPSIPTSLPCRSCCARRCLSRTW